MAESEQGGENMEEESGGDGQELFRRDDLLQTEVNMQDMQVTC